MDSGVSFGVGKAGQGFDPISFFTRPQVALRIVCWLCSLVVFCCIYAKGWDDKKCLYNSNANACQLATILGLIGVLGSMALLAFEALFQQISSIKVRRRGVAGDLLFSGVWAALFFVCFFYLLIAWNRAPYPLHAKGINSLRAAIVFSLFSVFTWAGCAYLAWMRWKAGVDMTQFTAGFEAGEEPNGGYAQYAAGTDPSGTNYEEGMYSGPIDQYNTSSNYPPPSY